MKLTQLRLIALMCWAVVTIISFTQGPAAAVAAFVAGGLAIECLKPITSRRLCAYMGTGLADIFIPEVYGAIQPNDSPETTAFAQSGVAVTNDVLRMAAMQGSRFVEVPLWNDLDQTSAPNLSDATDTEAVPGKITTTSWNARNAFLNKGYGAADLVVELSAGLTGDPLTRIRNRFATYWARQFQRRIIAISRGVLAKNIATNSGDMLNNIALETTVGVTAANKISAEAVIGACFTMGDRFETLRAIAMHSVPYNNLVLQQLITYVRDADGKLLYTTYLGLRVIVDDSMPVVAGTTSGFKYITILYGAGAIGYGEGSPKVPFEVDRIPAGGNGGGLENIWERKSWMIHPQGMDFLSGSVAGESPTEAELRAAANWARIVDRKNVPMAFLQTNG